MNHNWMNWVHTVTGGASARRIARQVGVSPQTVSNWFAREPSLAGVVGIAVAYQAPIIEGLLAAGVLTEDRLEGLFSMRHVPSCELVAELRRRRVLRVAS